VNLSLISLFFKGITDADVILVSPKAVLQEHTWWVLAAHGLVGPGAAAAQSNPLTDVR